MKIGMKPGESGEDVARLHRVLTHAGFTIDPDETKRREFGATTVDALRDLRRHYGLEETDEIDEPILQVLLELKQNISIDVSEDTSSAPKPQAQNRHHGVVTGRLVDENGAPLADKKVSLFSILVRHESHLADASTDKRGAYSISYRRARALNLQVRAFDQAEELIAKSAIAPAAPARVQLDLTTAPSGIVRPLSTFDTLTAAVEVQLEGTALIELSTDELRFVANAVGDKFERIAYLRIAAALREENDIRAQTLFGKHPVKASWAQGAGNQAAAGAQRCGRSAAMSSARWVGNRLSTS
ncbi:hypothetical protein, partial [Trinickia symbiotica]|uniref:hypothetical protein n=1 Tax=Trinickia symbiotica TaxID=863227 RepID=UPI001C62CCE5